MSPLITLRPVIESDLPVFFEHQLDADAARMAAFRSRDRDAFYAHWRKILADDTSIIRTIVAEGEVVGNVASWIADSKREVGYWVGRAFWGRGLATSALGQFLELAIERPLHAWVAARNCASIRVLEKCRFRMVDRETLDDAEGRPCEGLVMRLDGTW